MNTFAVTDGLIAFDYNTQEAISIVTSAPLGVSLIKDDALQDR
jgi:hypothetical protein